MRRGFLIAFLFVFGIALAVFSGILFDYGERMNNHILYITAGVLFVVGVVIAVGAYVEARGPYEKITEPVYSFQAVTEVKK